MKALTTAIALQLCITLIVPSVVWANPTSQPTTTTVTDGSTAQKLRLLPPWTMRFCRIDKTQDLRATYDKNGAVKLRLLDEQCAHWQITLPEQKKQIDDLKLANAKLLDAMKLGDNALKLSQERNDVLMKQVLKEIEEKNKYKYKPDHKWIYITIAGAVALAGIAFGAGVWISKSAK